MAESDKKESSDNFVLVINCSKCLSSQEFITRKYTKVNTSVSFLISVKKLSVPHPICMLFELYIVDMGLSN